MRRFAPVSGLCVCLGLAMLATPARAAGPPSPAPAQDREQPAHVDRQSSAQAHGHHAVDRSGRPQKGHASYYGPKFAHRKMADGNRMNPHDNVAASRTLPLGTTAKVTNLANGKSTQVKVEDRGPYIDGRVMDVSPKAASELGMKKRGVAPVEVKPVTVPLPNGDVKLGSGAADLPPQAVERAAKQTKELASGQ